MFLSVEKKDLSGVICPECGSNNVKEYPVLSDGGWFTVVKCQDCLYSLERNPFPPEARLGNNIRLISEHL
jgi:hypothetical protein